MTWPTHMITDSQKLEWAAEEIRLLRAQVQSLTNDVEIATRCLNQMQNASIRMPSLRVVINIAKVFDCSVDRVIYGKGK